jgi:hypothetical protein
MLYGILITREQQLTNCALQKVSTATAPANPAPANPAPAVTAATPSEPATTPSPEEPAKITKQGEDQAHTFTTADDAQLIEMKATGKTWKEIVAEMKKSQSTLKERFKEIGPKADSGVGKDENKEDAETRPAEDKKAENQSQKAANTGEKGKKDANNTAAKVGNSSLILTSLLPHILDYSSIQPYIMPRPPPLPSPPFHHPDQLTLFRCPP